MKQLAGVFAIDVAAYAVMSNHYHLVLRVDAQRARAWGQDEVLLRWTRIFTGPVMLQDYLRARERGEDASLDEAIVQRIAELAEVYRARLMDISWFMRVLNESVARQANAEDGVTGRFWEGRFKSQALLDEQAILTAMAYVDLNPIRAAMAETPEESAHTSVAERIRALRGGDEVASKAHNGGVKRSKAVAATPAVTVSVPTADNVHSILWLRREEQLAKLTLQPLMPFDATGRLRAAIPFSLEDYLELVEATGRCQHPHKRGQMPESTPRLLERLELDPERFVECSAKMMKHFGSAVGASEVLSAHCARRQVKYLRGLGAARRLERLRVA
ncbi:MAG: transposase [Thauera sp.]|jgi:hypothetical protein|nr:transposase [Thauera sp.]